MGPGASRGTPEATFFPTADALHQWFEGYGARAKELWLGFHKVGSGRPSVTYPEALDEALCVGWIDGVRHSLGRESYTIRFTPRKSGSNWSQANVRHVRRLRREGRMQAAGLRAYEARRRGLGQLYSFEAHGGDLDVAALRLLRRVPAARRYWEAQPPSYRKMASWWVMSAKRNETRAHRLAALIECCNQGCRIPLAGGPRNPAKKGGTGNRAKLTHAAGIRRPA